MTANPIDPLRKPVVMVPLEGPCRCRDRGRWRRRTRAAIAWYLRICLLAAAVIVLLDVPAIAQWIGYLAAAVLVATGADVANRELVRLWRGVPEDWSR